MAVTKKAAFLKPEVRLSEFAKALSHPARVAILKLLAERGTCICGEIVDELPLAQATVSQHLRTLKEAGLIQGEIEGPRTCYCIDPKGLQDFRLSIRFLFAQLETTIAHLNRNTT